MDLPEKYKLLRNIRGLIGAISTHRVIYHRTFETIWFVRLQNVMSLNTTTVCDRITNDTTMIKCLVISPLVKRFSASIVADLF